MYVPSKVPCTNVRVIKCLSFYSEKEEGRKKQEQIKNIVPKQNYN